MTHHSYVDSHCLACEIVPSFGLNCYLPNNKEYSVPQIKMLLSEIEHGVKKKISIDIWESL
jgi:hypothetical protein